MLIETRTYCTLVCSCLSLSLSQVHPVSDHDIVLPAAAPHPDVLLPHPHLNMEQVPEDQAGKPVCVCLMHGHRRTWVCINSSRLFDVSLWQGDGIYDGRVSGQLWLVDVNCGQLWKTGVRCGQLMNDSLHNKS